MTNQQLSYDTTLLSCPIPLGEESENKPAFVPVEWAREWEAGVLPSRPPPPDPCYLFLFTRSAASVCVQH